MRVRQVAWSSYLQMPAGEKDDLRTLQGEDAGGAFRGVYLAADEDPDPAEGGIEHRQVIPPSW